VKDLVYVVAKLQARSGKEEGLRKQLEALIEPTKREKGCRRYSLMQDRQNPAVLTILEEWETEADLNTHLALPHLQTLFSQLPELLAAPPDIVRYKQIG
jgi:quinol monooxygenase YgiN